MRGGTWRLPRTREAERLSAYLVADRAARNFGGDIGRSRRPHARSHRRSRWQPPPLAARSGPHRRRARRTGCRGFGTSIRIAPRSSACRSRPAHGNRGSPGSPEGRPDIVDALLAERPAYTLRHTALHLALDIGGMDRPAHILDRRVTQDPDVAGLRVDLDIANMRREARRLALRVDLPPRR